MYKTDLLNWISTGPQRYSQLVEKNIRVNWLTVVLLQLETRQRNRKSRLAHFLRAKTSIPAEIYKWNKWSRHLNWDQVKQHYSLGTTRSAAWNKARKDVCWLDAACINSFLRNLRVKRRMFIIPHFAQTWAGLKRTHKWDIELIIILNTHQSGPIGEKLDDCSCYNCLLKKR